MTQLKLPQLYDPSWAGDVLSTAYKVKPPKRTGDMKDDTATQFHAKLQEHESFELFRILNEAGSKIGDFYEFKDLWDDDRVYDEMAGKFERMLEQPDKWRATIRSKRRRLLGKLPSEVKHQEGRSNGGKITALQKRIDALEKRTEQLEKLIDDLTKPLAAE